MSIQMQAVVVQEHGAPEHMKLVQQPMPQPQPHQVLLRMTMTSVNFADVKARRAPYRHFQAPFVPGFDGVGVIEEVGDAVVALSAGQRVAAYVKGGSYASHALADEVLCYPLPDEVSDQDAASIGVAITAYNALHWAGRLEVGEQVLVHAASGGVGSAALQLARLGGAKTVFATAGSETKATICKQLGADHVFLYDPFEESLKQHAPGGIELVLDTIGGPVLEQSLSCLAPFGRLVTFGHSTGQDGMIPSRPLHRHNLSVIGYSSGGVRKKQPERLRPTAEAVIALWKQGALKTHVGGTYPLSEAAAAHALFEQRQNQGKILLKP